MFLRFLPLIIFAMLFCPALSARTPQRTQKSVRDERRAATEKIEQTRRSLSANELETQRELSKLQSLEGEIRQHEGELARLNSRLTALRHADKALADSIADNETALKAMRQSYAKAMRTLRRQRQLADDAAFIVSSSSFAQARSRMRYLKELGKWQSDKTAEIALASKQLERRKARLDTLRIEITAGIDSIELQRRILGERKHQADAVVGSLKRQSKNLRRVINEQQQLVDKLDRELNRIIEEEARAAEEARRKAQQTGQKEDKPQSGGKTSAPKAEPAEAVDRLTTPFAQCKGRLPWPIDRKATVTSTFGRHTHRSLDKVTVQNNGIDFETSPGASARAVYDGVVSMVIVMDGYHNVVLVRHGEYLTVYAGLSDLKVRKGDKVKAGQLLGDIFADPADNNRTRLHFEVRHEKDKLDPSQWLKP